MNFTKSALFELQEVFICPKAPEEKFREVKNALREHTDLKEDSISRVLESLDISEFRGPLKTKSAYSDDRKKTLMFFVAMEFLKARLRVHYDRFFKVCLRRLLDFIFDADKLAGDPIGYQAAKILLEVAVEHSLKIADWEMFLEELSYSLQIFVDGDFILSMNHGRVEGETERSIYFDRTPKSGYHIDRFRHFLSDPSQALNSIYIERILDCDDEYIPEEFFMYDSYQ